MSRVVGQNSLCVSQRQAKDFLQLFFLIFEMGGMIKPLMTASAENSRFCFSETHNVPRDEAGGTLRASISLGASHNVLIDQLEKKTI